MSPEINSNNAISDSLFIFKNVLSHVFASEVLLVSLHKVEIFTETPNPPAAVAPVNIFIASQLSRSQSSLTASRLTVSLILLLYVCQERGSQNRHNLHTPEIISSRDNQAIKFAACVIGRYQVIVQN